MGMTHAVESWRKAEAGTSTAGWRAIRWWLVATAMVVVATIAIGGATRLTESGLSITEWKPITGVLPPLSARAWEAAFEQYLAIPEAQTVHAGITQSQFRVLYWWEWAHRLIARVTGLVVAIPFLVFWMRGRIPQPLFWRLASLPLLVGAQGALGWYMVQSGLSDRTSVSPYRLVAHLSLALLIFGIAVATAARLRDVADVSTTRRERSLMTALTAAVVVTMLSGGFVAGLDAGRIFNEFPLMGGQVVPPGYDGGLGWRNAFENPIAAQFNHRVLAMLTAMSVLAAWGVVERRGTAAGRSRFRAAAAVVVAQVALGIGTLLSGADVAWAVLHQLGAVALLGILLWRDETGQPGR